MRGISLLAERISNGLVKKGIITKEEEEMYHYGVENGIVIAGNLLTSLIVGIVTGRLGIIIAFLLFYATLRSYSGGILTFYIGVKYISYKSINITPIIIRFILTNKIKYIRKDLLNFFFISFSF